MLLCPPSSALFCFVRLCSALFDFLVSNSCSISIFKMVSSRSTRRAAAVARRAIEARREIAREERRAKKLAKKQAQFVEPGWDAATPAQVAAVREYESSRRVRVAAFKARANLERQERRKERNTALRWKRLAVKVKKVEDRLKAIELALFEEPNQFECLPVDPLPEVGTGLVTCQWCKVTYFETDLVFGLEGCNCPPYVPRRVVPRQEEEFPVYNWEGISRPLPKPRDEGLARRLRAKILELMLARTALDGQVYVELALRRCLSAPTLSEDVEPAMDAGEYFSKVEVDMEDDSIFYNKVGGDFVYDVDMPVPVQLKKVSVIQAEADDESSPCPDIVVEQKSNVILTTHKAEESVSKPITIQPGIWEEFCSSSKKSEYVELMTRWQRFKTVKWSVNDGLSKDLLAEDGKYCILPLDFIKSDLDSPNNILFKQYAYFRSDLEVKFVINSNKFHCGSLQASFYYGASSDKHYKDRANVFSASQMSNCIIDAASASDATMIIPYRNYKPLMPTVARPDDKVVLDMGALRLLVLNPLKLPTNDNNVIDVTVFIRFIEPHFHGMKPRGMGAIQGEMMGMAALVSETANLIQQIHPDPQRDNPSDVRPPNPMVPWSSHSWCLGDSTPVALNPLRLQAVGNTPHLPGTLPAEPEMQISYINSIFGLIAQVPWKSSDATGKVLLKLAFSPSLSDYPQIMLNNGGNLYCDIMPPVSVMAQFFALWRGSLEYRLDFVATQFHTGRLIIAYIPRVTGLTEPTLAQLTHCDHIVVDLRDEKQVSYINSFISDKPWYPRRTQSRQSTEVYPPGYIYIAVMNQLTATTAVSDTIAFNVYMRAGKDYEVHVPVDPKIGLSFNTSLYFSPEQGVSYVPGYGPPATDLYIGIWHSVENHPVFRYGPVSDHISQFKTEDFTAYKGKVLEVEKGPIPMYGGKEIRFMVLFKLSASDTYVYGAPFRNKTTASKQAEILATTDGIMQEFSHMESAQSEDGPYVAREQIVWKESAATLDDFEFVISEAGDERKNVCGEVVQVQGNLRSTSSGLLTFGEQITNIKPLLRRYVPYCQLAAKLSSDSVDPRLALFTFPVLPQGLDLNVLQSGREDIYTNRIRDGPISILASGYRYFRGDVRYRFVVSSPGQTALWVQHRPEYNLQSLSVTTPSPRYTSSYFNPGYAFRVVDTQVNRIEEIEVPFYQPGQLGLLQRPNLEQAEDAVHYSLGTMYVGLSSLGLKKDSRAAVQVFHAMGDNMSFSVFQGFPPMIDLSIFDEKKTIQAEGLFDSISTYVTKKVEDRSKEVVLEQLQTMTGDNTETDFKALVTKLLPDIKAEQQAVFINILCNISISLINPNIKTVCLCIANSLINLGLLAVGMVSRFISKLSDLFSRWLSPRPQQQQTGQIVSEADDEDTLLCASYLSVCITSMVTLLGCVGKPLPSNLPDFASYLKQGLPKFTLTASGLFTFMKNNIRMFTSMWKWLVAKFKPDYLFYSELSTAPEKMKEYVKKIQWCLEARNAETVRSDPVATTLVYELANVAQSFLAHKSLTSVNREMPLFIGYLRNIIRLRDDLASEMYSPQVRFEPYVISLVGETNCGKSHLAQKMAFELLKSIDYKTYSELVYVRTPGNAYWNGLKNQPICLFDDFLQIKDSQFALLSAGELFCLKSKAVFNPPMAAIEEKKLRYNPLCVFLCANEAFPKVAGLASDEAFLRRRDMLACVRKKAEFKGISPRNMERDVKKHYKHLEFCFYANPAGLVESERKLEMKDKKENWMNYDEFLPKVIERFHEYFYEECQQYDEALQQVGKLYPGANETTEEFVNRYEQQLQAINDHRVSAEDKTIIENVLGRLRQNKYIDNMASYVSKSIVNIKTKKMEEEVQRATVNAGASSSGVPSPVCNPSPTVNPTAEGPAIVPITASEIKTNVDLAATALARKYNVNLLTCNCREKNIYMFPQAFHSGQRWVITFDAKKTDKRLTFYLTKMQEFAFLRTVLMEATICGDGCVARQRSWIEFLWKQGIFSRHSEANIPAVFWDHRPAPEETGDSSCYTDEVELDEAVAAEIDDPKWYEKLWNNIPTWRTVFWWLTKAAAVFGALSFLVRLGGFLFASPIEAKNTVKAAQQVSKFQENTDLWLANDERKIELESKVLSMMDDAIDTSKEPEGYTKDVSAPSVNKAVLNKVYQQASTEMSNVVTNYIRKNTFWILVESGPPEDRKVRWFRCLGLKERWVVIIDHYVFYFKTLINPIYSFIKDGMQLSLSPEFYQKALKSANSALYVLQMPVQIPMFKNIIKFFQRQSGAANVCQGTLYEYCIATDGTFNMNAHQLQRITLEESITVNNDDGSLSPVNTVYNYNVSGKGMCGSVLVSARNTQHPIIGLHIAGHAYGNSGYSEAITFETFERLQSTLVESEMTNYDVNPDGKPILSLDGNVNIVGTVQRKHAQYPPIKTRLVHTENAGEISEVTYDFPLLSSKDPRIEDAPFSPLLEGVKHHTEVCLPMPSRLVRSVVEDVDDMFLSNAVPQRAKVGRLEYQDAICGIPAMPGYEGMEMDTSEGFPWINRRPKNAANKKWLFNREETKEGWKLISMDSQLEAWLSLSEAERQSGKFMQTIFVDCLKDAKAKKEKACVRGSTRVFSLSPVDYTIMVRQYMLDFVASFMACRENLGHRVGMNINSMETDVMINKLLRKGNNLMCGDHKKFGDKLYVEFTIAFFEMVGRWYRRNNPDLPAFYEQVIRALGWETSHAYHLMLDLVYQCVNGIPSGCPITIVVDVYVNMCYMRLAWLQIWEEQRQHQMATLAAYYEQVEEVFYGDDVVLSIKDDSIEHFNAINISRILKYYDLDFTNASKSDQIISHTGISDSGTTFLKCTFHRHPFRKCWMARLDERAMLETSNWTWSTQQDHRGASVHACKEMVRLAFGFGPEYYNALRRKVIDYWSVRQEKVSLPLWEQEDLRIYDN
nr:MAG: hypothetical protein [Iflaviridae sp.]